MQIYVLSESLFVDSPWYKVIYSGLINEISKRKMTFESSISPEYMNDNDFDFAFLIGTNINWLDETVMLCEKYSIHPIILSTLENSRFYGKCSCVTPNIAHSMDYLISYLNNCGKSKTALYGVNRLSLTNITQMNQFLSNQSCNASVDDVYFNDGSITDCGNLLLENIYKYDSIISVNDFATISLMRKLANLNQDVTIVSFGGTKLAKKYFPKLLTVSMGYEDFGKAAFLICDAVKSDSSMDCMTISVKCRIDDKIISDSDYGIYCEKKVFTDVEDKKFYSDIEMNELLRIENMLRLCDDMDSEIINSLMCSLSYEEIAEKLFCALNTVKYRVKKLKEGCGCSSKKEMIDLICKYCKI